MIIKGDNDKLIQAINLSKVSTDTLTIGLLKEHTLHRVLKFYYSNDLLNQEVKINKMFADIVIDNHIYEIQTKQFNLLREKLDVFLNDHQVTIVYPIAENKEISLLNKMNEEISFKKSPKHDSLFSLFVELYKIKKYLNNKNLSFHIVMLDIIEIREQEEKKRYHSKGFIRINQIPKRINNIYTLENKEDYLELFNLYNLPEEFDSSIFSKKVHVVKNKASTILNVLLELDVVERIDKRGRSYIYKIKK